MRTMRRDASNQLKPGLYLGGGIILLFIVMMFRPFTIVNAGERGVVTEFGKVQDRILNEGFHFIMPVANKVHKLNVRVKQNSFKADAASRDLQKVSTEIAINWHINPQKANKVYQQVGDEQQIVVGIMTPAVSEVLKAATAKKTAEEIITKRNELKEEIDEQMTKRMADYGVIVDDVSLVDFAFSPEFSRAIEAKQIAEQEAKQAEFIAKKATQEAQAEINRAKGHAEAQRLQRQTLTPELLQKQAIEKWDGKFPMVMGGNNTLPMINVNPGNFSNKR
ncbi:MAG: prohibitin family protein [Nostocaceae cyanobacterium]|nr:prohibitin family protein [Nostocaceae cyanobacterium]